MSLSCPTPREGRLSVAAAFLIASPAFVKTFNDLPQEGKADPSPAKRDGRADEGGRRLIETPKTSGRTPLSSPGESARTTRPPASFKVWGETRFPLSCASDPNSDSRHAKSLASAGSQDKAVTPSGGSLAKPKRYSKQALHRLYGEKPGTFTSDVEREIQKYVK